jgi:hypothetical protein
VEKRAGRRCEYCHAPQRVSGYRFHVEHILPRTRRGPDTLNNRALACATCNFAKAGKAEGIDPVTGEKTALFHPRAQTWHDHFYWGDDHQTLIGVTPTGRATIAALDMNNELHHEARRLWFETGWLP